MCYGEDLGPDWTRFPVARLHYTKTTGPWARYWRDRNLNTTAANLSIPAHPPVQTFLDYLDDRADHIFWG